MLKKNQIEMCETIEALNQLIQDKSKEERGRLFGGTVPPNNFLFGGTCPMFGDI